MSQVHNGIQIIDDTQAGDEKVQVARLCEVDTPDDLLLASSCRRRHIEMLCFSIAVLIGATVLQIPDGHRVALPGLPQLPFPETCMSKAWFGVSCPGCGLTRSFICMIHGHWVDAVAYNRVGPILFLCTLIQIPYRAIGLCCRLNYPLGRRVARGTARMLIGLLIGNWLISFFL